MIWPKEKMTSDHVQDAISQVFSLSRIAVGIYIFEDEKLETKETNDHLKFNADDSTEAEEIAKTKLTTNGVGQAILLAKKVD